MFLKIKDAKNAHKNTDKLRAILSKAAKLKKLVRPFFMWLTKPRTEVRYDVHGVSGAHWPFLRRDHDKILKIVSMGVGEDLSYELSIDKLANCNFTFFDPTLKALRYYESVTSAFYGRNFFNNIAVIGNDGPVSFSLPENEAHVSVKITTRPSEDSVNFPCIKVEELHGDILNEIDYLKMDIEGAEINVLKKMIKLGIRPKCILVEFHHWIYWDNSLFTVFILHHHLKKVGYNVFYQSNNGAEYGFILRK